MKFIIFPIIFLGITGVALSYAHRILAIIPVNLKSHFLVCQAIIKGLAKRGHRVDVVSHFPQKKTIPNYHDIVNLAGTIPETVNNMTFDFASEMRYGSFVRIATKKFGNDICLLLEHPKMKELIKNPPQDEPYDLVISQLHTAFCFLAFGHHLKVPVVSLSTNVPHPWINGLLGNPDNTAYISNTLQGFSENMNFWERLQNTVYTISDKFWFKHYSSPQDDIVKKHFGPDTPGLRELERSIALLLVNSHFSLNGVKPLTPAVVEIGGAHIEDDGPKLSTELKKWLDESRDGFVYFTFGSLVKIESLPKEKLVSMYGALAKITPVRVLMKIANVEELPPGLPQNVKTLPWINQYAVMKHKNIRAFITHGGLLSTMEAVTCEVPMIGIPLFVDQYLNINTYVQKGMAIRLTYEDITEETMYAALNAILKDPAYKKATRKVSVQFRDRPMSAINTAIFWVEYVIRNGPNALRSPSLDLTWWQVALLDVFGFLLLVGLLIAYMLKVILKRITSYVSGRDDVKIQAKKKA